MHNGITSPFLEVPDKVVWFLLVLYNTIRFTQKVRKQKETQGCGWVLFFLVLYNTIHFLQTIYINIYERPKSESTIGYQNWITTPFMSFMFICVVSRLLDNVFVVLYYVVIILVYPFWYVHIMFSKGEPNVMPSHVADLVSILFELQKMYL